MAKQNLVRNRTVYVTARQRQREYRHGLGVLREALSDQVGKHVAKTLSKDLLSLAPAELVERLKTELAGD